MMKAYFERFARYNRWANARLYEAVGMLSPEAFVAPRSGFFPSIMLSLNHILVADRVWMSRFTGKPAGVVALDQVLHGEFDELKSARVAEDQLILSFVSGLPEADLPKLLHYRTLTDAKETRSELAPTLGHFFNHQTHHRGQVHAMLSATEVKPPPLDFIYFIRESD